MWQQFVGLFFLITIYVIRFDEVFFCAVCVLFFVRYLHFYVGYIKYVLLFIDDLVVIKKRRVLQREY